jgi:hypothetical protein
VTFPMSKIDSAREITPSPRAPLEAGTSDGYGTGGAGAATKVY